MKFFRNIAIGVVALVALVLVVAAVFLGLIFDPNDYRDKIAELARTETGRDLRIEGELDVQYFPWLGFDVGRTQLGEDPSFGDQPFVSLDKASVRVKLLPLLGFKLEIGEVIVEGLDVNLIRNEAGVDNWQSLVDALGGEDPPADAAPAEEGGVELAGQGIGGVTIRQAAIVFDDRQAGSKTTLEGFDLTTGSIVPGRPVGLETGFDVKVSEGDLEARVEIAGELRLEDEELIVAAPTLSVRGGNDPRAGSVPFASFEAGFRAPQIRSDGENHEVAAPELSFAGSGGVDGLTAVAASLTAEALTAAGETLRVQAPALEVELDAEGLAAGTPVRFAAGGLDVALGEQTMELADYRLNVLDLEVSGQVNGTRIVDDPDIRGTFAIKEFSPRALLGKLDVAVETADDTALSSFAGGGSLRVGANSLRVGDMDMRLDDTRIRGFVAQTDIETGALAFDIDIDAIDADRYLAPGAVPEEGGGSAADAVEIPAQSLRELALSGSLKIGRLKFSGIESSNVEVGINARDGDIRVHPSRADLYGGSYTGDIRVNASGEVPVLSMNERVTDIDFGAFAGTVIEDSPLKGRVTGSLALEGRGHNTNQIRETLNGRTSFAFADGVIEGVDLMEILEGIVSLIDRKVPTRTSGPRRTEFSRLGGDAVVTDGVIRTENLTVAAAALEIGGKGMVDLNTRAVDFEIDTRIVETDGAELSPGLQKAVGYNIPVYIGGTYDAPEPARLDRSAAALVKQFGARKLVDRLGLFDKDEDKQAEGEGAAPAEGEEQPKDLEEQLEDKAKDVLRDLLGGG